jgi:hypothetical protein
MFAAKPMSGIGRPHGSASTAVTPMSGNLASKFLHVFEEYTQMRYDSLRVNDNALVWRQTPFLRLEFFNRFEDLIRPLRTIIIHIQKIRIWDPNDYPIGS